MGRSKIAGLYDGLVLIDTSAVVALLDDSDQFHEDATLFFENPPNVRWISLNVTAHETFTRLRYNHSIARGIQGYDFLRSDSVRVLHFEEDDDLQAKQLLEKYNDQVLSYHGALCAAVMISTGIYKVFGFDKDFFVFGFELLPGPYR